MGKHLKAIAIDHINMKVKSLEKSVKFYKDMFGFEVKIEDNFPNKLKVPSKIIGNDSVILCLYEVPDMSPEGGITHFGFHVRNFQDIEEKCKKWISFIHARRNFPIQGNPPNVESIEKPLII